MTELPWTVTRKWETGHPQTGKKSEIMGQFRYKPHAEIYLRGLGQVQEDAHLLYELTYQRGIDEKTITSNSPYRRDRPNRM
ncbi:MAG TPA: hypothetical protein V6C63_12235 [Allocoleopsis sp.]